MPTTTKPSAAAARAQRVATLRNRATAGVVATFILALGAVGFDGSLVVHAAALLLVAAPALVLLARRWLADPAPAAR